MSRELRVGPRSPPDPDPILGRFCLLLPFLLVLFLQRPTHILVGEDSVRSGKGGLGWAEGRADWSQETDAPGLAVGTERG